jgi:hypothetical protein
MITARAHRTPSGHSRRRLLLTLDSRRIRRATLFFVVACSLLSNACPEAFARNDESAEYPIKLGFLYNFTKFVEWPAESYRDAGAPLTICIVGRDPFSADLEAELRTRKVGEHPVQVKALKATDPLSGCHIVFVPATEKGHFDIIMKDLAGSSSLTVGESDGFAAMGGVINLIVEENKVHFEVNPLAAERARLKISSKLMTMAKIVKEQGRGVKGSQAPGN